MLENSDINDTIEHLNTCLMGKVLKFDGRLAEVQPQQPKKLVSGELLIPSVIYDVPICLMISNSGNAKITVPIKPGDDVILFFSQRSIGAWKRGEDMQQEESRKFDLSDAIAMPLLRPTVGEVSTDNIEISLNGNFIKILPSGDMQVKGGNISVSAKNIDVRATNVNVKGSSATVDAPTTFLKPVIFSGGFTASAGGGTSPATIKGELKANKLTSTGEIKTDGNITAGGNITASGSVHGSNI